MRRKSIGWAKCVFHVHYFLILQVQQQEVVGEACISVDVGASRCLDYWLVGCDNLVPVEQHLHLLH